MGITAIVAGALANKPSNGGNAWTRLQWVLGLGRLGVQVQFVEQIDSGACVDVAGAACTFDASAQRAYFRAVAEAFGLTAQMSLICTGSDDVEGLGLDELRRFATSADLLVNISGHLTVDTIKGGPRVRVYYDDDPGFTQFWHSSGNPGPRLEGHDLYYTVGANIGTPACPIPTVGVEWRGMMPPVVLSEWPVVRGVRPVRFTTVASWRGAYGPIEFAGRRYGVKAHEFRKFADLPRKAPGKFEVALAIHPADCKDLHLLLSGGWQTVDPRAVADSPAAYRSYLQGSGAEFSPAQGVYVDTQSGWFSDRTACYLASGKPALVQDTGFGTGSVLGKGLVPFSSLDEAADGALRIVADYPAHCRAARQVAEDWFDSDRVLGRLLADTGLIPSAAIPVGRSWEERS